MNIEKHAFSIIAFIVILLVNFAIFYFTLFPKDQMHFLGRRVINSQDTFTYISYIEQSKAGNYLLQNLYTTEEQIPTLVRPSYVLLGKIASVFSLSGIEAYHLGRIVTSVIFCYVLYFLVRRFFTKVFDQIIAFVVVLTSGGVGSLLFTFYPNAIDLWVPEAFTFLSLSESPHFILSYTLMLTSILSYLRYIESGYTRYAIGIVLSLLLLSFEHPFNLIIIIPTLLLTSFITKSITMKRIVPVLFLSSIGLLYPIMQQQFNTLFSLEQSQGASISPSPINYVVGLGFLLLLSIWGMELRWKKRSLLDTLLVTWIALSFLLIYAPFSFQRRLIEGTHVPLALFASVSILYLYSKIKSRLKQLAFPVLCLCICFLANTSWVSMIRDFLTISQDNASSYYYHLPDKDMSALVWIQENTNQHDVILSNWFYGNIIPGLIGRKVYVGHKAQTIRFDEKIDLVNNFLIDDQIVSGYSFLIQNNISYIFLGQNDSMLAYGFSPDQRSYLTKVYDSNGVLVYKVNE